MRISLVLLLIVLISFSSFSQNTQIRDGKLLRGEKWQRFTTEKADLYVATNGNDNWSGTLDEPNANKTDGPFATLAQAQQAVRELKAQVFKPKKAPVETRWIGSPHELGKGKDIVVYIRDGYYSLEKPLVFKPEDGGERVETNMPTGAFEYHKLRDHYVTYAAYPGEKPVISGGKAITNWKQNGEVWTSQVNDHKVKLLLANSKLQTLARTPNTEYFTPPSVSKATSELPFRPGDVKNWENMEDNRVVMLLRWHAGYNSFAKVDEKNEIAYFKEPEEGVVIVPPRYYVENVKALLDAPGEWYFDKNNNELSYIPESGISDPNNANIFSSQLDELVSIQGEKGKPVRNLRFYGLTFEGALPGKNAISVEYAHACELVESEVRSCGGAGVRLYKGCYQTQILENRFEKIENRVIIVDGEHKPEGAEDILRETTISYNQLYDNGGVNIYAANSLYTTISHNYITKTRGRYAIDVGRWQNLEEAIDGNYLVEYNHLDDVQKDADDSGAIKTTGLTFNSVVRRNLIHDVNAGFFNDNVAFWFDNMSSQWISEENIYYNLEQGEMKLCAANLVDNIYRNNFKIDPPKNKPEIIINGEPEIEYSNLVVSTPQKTSSGAAVTGSIINVSADLNNIGSTGIVSVDLYLDGKVYEKKMAPSIHNNTSMVNFDLRIYEPGEHEVAIGGTAYKSFNVEGEKPSFVFEKINLSHNRIPLGEKITVSALAKNLKNSTQINKVQLFVDNKVVDEIEISVAGNETKSIEFQLTPKSGEQLVRIGNSDEAGLSVYKQKTLVISKKSLKTYCSPTADPSVIEVDTKKNVYKIKASGSDFFHAEDSYASIFADDIKGDFVATVKITEFGNRTHEWFRSGLFVRNDITKSFDTEPGSKGSVLMFGTTGRAGIHYDEFGDGCMHKANSENIPEDITVPVWLKLIRHGNSFTGYVSYDGINWQVERRTNDIPGLNSALDIGMAAGSCDKNQYWVEFQDFKIEVEK
jgi:regulation of enolase protein 1 (concanavalin A-like superfamily)